MDKRYLILLAFVVALGLLTRSVSGQQELNLNAFEPIIAVDPNNPMHLAVATYLRVRVSTDGGLTFQPTVMMTAPPGYSTASGGDPTLAYDSQGRLFFSFLLVEFAVGGFDVFIAQLDPTTGAVLPGYPINLSAGAGVPNDNVIHSHDKEWIAIDHYVGSPHQDNIYVVWTDFGSGFTTVLTSFSTDQGLTWSAALPLSALGEGFVWPSENAVAPNGDVYVGYHSQPTFSGPNPDGNSGQIFMLRSTDGGQTYPQKNLAYGPGEADITFNVQSGTRVIPNTQFWLQGSVQPRILVDPFTAGRVYVVANDEQIPGDMADVFMVTSVDFGQTWSEPMLINGGGNSIQVMPSAAIDPDTGCITVSYYDNRNGAFNANGNFLLDLFATVSSNGGATFSPEFQVNTVAFDPDLNAPCRFGPVGCGSVDTVNTLRIGEYNGLAAAGGVAFQVWTGNDALGNQDTFFEAFSSCVPCTLSCPPSITQPNDPNQCFALVNFPPPIASGGCGAVTCTQESPSFFAVGSTPVTCTSITGATCMFVVTIVDTQAPVITCPANLIVGNDPGLDSAVVDSFSATASDNCPGVTSSCIPPPGSTFPLGDTSVTCTAEDAAGNEATCDFTITVIDCRTLNFEGECTAVSGCEWCTMGGTAYGQCYSEGRCAEIRNLCDTNGVGFACLDPIGDDEYVWCTGSWFEGMMPCPPGTVCNTVGFSNFFTCGLP